MGGRMPRNVPKTGSARAERLEKQRKARSVEKARKKVEYDPSFVGEVVALGEGGHVEVEIATELGVSRRQLQVWGGAYPEFKEAMERAYELSLAFWMKKLVSNLNDRGFNYQAFRAFMSSNFADDYRDQPPQKIELKGLLARLDVGKLDDRTLTELADRPLETLLNLSSEPKALPSGN